MSHLGQKKQSRQEISSYGKRNLSLLTLSQPHLLPGAAEAALQNCLYSTNPLGGRIRFIQYGGPG